MASYTKGLKTIKVYTRGGDEFTATDVEKHQIASNALEEFLGGKVMHIFNDPKDYVPFKAVDRVEVTNTVGEFEREDAYCEDTVLKVGKGKACEAPVGC